ncbi:MAG: S49 family peptidase [Alphaproteobacteria bacterium]
MDRVRSLIPGQSAENAPIVPVVKFTGIIGRGSKFRPGLSMQSAAGPLKKAFGIKAAPAVAIVIDSPGGSPVQSHLIHKRIRALAEETEKRVLIFTEDVCASGGYMIACAGDEIIVNPASIVGSIGVVSAGFGFVDAIEKLGVQRRVYTAGKNKSTLDPFKPEKTEDIDHLKSLQSDVHDLFIDLVKGRRGDVLADDDDLFTGLFWSGAKAVSLGLADREGDLRTVLRDMYGEKVRMKVISGERSFWARRGMGLSALGDVAVERVFAELDERVLRSRFGL